MLSVVVAVDLEDLVEASELYQTKVSWSVYGDYIRAMGGYGILAFLLVSFAVSIGIQSATTWFLSFWLNQGDGVSRGGGQCVVLVWVSVLSLSGSVCCLCLGHGVLVWASVLSLSGSVCCPCLGHRVVLVWVTVLSLSGSV